MKGNFLFLLLIIFSPGLTGQKSIEIPAKPLAIIHATMVNVITGKLDADQTILIDSNRISTVGPTQKIKVPVNSSVIDASGKYIMPGMTDAHIHFFQSGGLYTRPDGLNLNAVYPYEKDQQWIRDNLNDLMARYLACGVTTVIDVGGPLSNYSVRDKVNSDSRSPNALVTGPLISTYEPPNLDKKDPPIIKVKSADEARELVRKQLPYKPDFIKIWYIVLPGQKAENSLPIVKGTIEESHAHGLKVTVHATEYETARLAVTAGADILVHSVDDRILDDEMLQLLRSRQTVYIPTLLVAQNYDRVFTQQFNFTEHDLQMANPFMLGTLMDLQHIEKTKIPFDYQKMRSRLPIPSKADTTMLVNLKLVQEKGGLVVAGTDAGNIGTHHGSSHFAELMAMKQAGLSNWQIIMSTTINAARGFGKEKDHGSIEKGKIADLLLLEKDPTQDLNTLSHINSIIHRGIPMTPQQLLPPSPEILVQQQLNAYNARDINAFLQPYATDVELYTFPDKLISKGKDQMRKSYLDMFEKTPNLHCQVTERIIQGNTVIDHENVTGFGVKTLKTIAIYKMDNNRISKVYFIQ